MIRIYNPEPNKIGRPATGKDPMRSFRVPDREWADCHGKSDKIFIDGKQLSVARFIRALIAHPDAVEHAAEMLSIIHDVEVGEITEPE